jgi:predicted signal transduction protein with EAL and GGDEF domain
MRMPMDRTPPPALAESLATGRLPRARLVLVSADPSVEVALRAMLSRDAQGAVTTVTDPDAASTAIEARRLDLLLLDLDPSPASALDLIGRLRADARWRFLPIVVLAGGTDPALRLAALERGATDVVDKPADPVELELRLRNTLALKAHYDRLQQLDPVTGLANRDEFLRRVDALLVEGTPAPGEADLRPRRTLARLDLDGFRAALDALGQDAGDQLLGVVAQRLIEVIVRCNGGSSRRANDPTLTPWVARMNRDTFLMLLAGGRGDPQLEQCLAAISETLRRPFELDDDAVMLVPTIGIAHFPEHGSVATDLVHRAGLAVRVARRDARLATAVYTASIGERAQERLAVEQELRRAIERDEFRVHYQPKRDVVSLEIVGAEALVRWAHPQRGLLAPSKFIGFAEESGLVAAIGRRVLEIGCRQLVDWDAVLVRRNDDTRRPPLRMAINLSALQFGLGDIAPAVAGILQDTGVAGSRLTLELTETLLIDEGEEALAQLRALKALDVELSLDDFGTGYSSLAYLRRFPLDEVKIDRSFVQDLAHDRSARAIVDAIIGLGRKLGLRVVAEGVEIDAQLAVLRELGCNQFQGYLFDGEPADGAELTRRLA